MYVRKNTPPTFFTGIQLGHLLIANLFENQEAREGLLKPGRLNYESKESEVNDNDER